MNQRELTNRLNIASIKYYKGETTEYTDTQFDLALKELQNMEKESGIVYPDSPTLRVGSDLQKEFKKVKHPVPMLTIENTYNAEELDKWAEKMNTEWGARNYDIELKYDGVSCELYYKGGHFVNASTRGDKNIGDDITLNVYGVHDIPFELIGFGENEEFWVRGEILMPKSVLAKLNEERMTSGEQPFANTRNACAGSIKQLDHKVTASRGLVFRAWDCFGTDIMHATMWSKHTMLYMMGFKHEYTPTQYQLNSDESLSSFVEKQKKFVDDMNLDYDYDGMVIKVNDTNLQMRIGTKDTRAIEWGIARKWNEEYEVWTELRDVEWQVGRTGVVTPVGILEPVECAGVVISNVTLHNVDFIENIDLHLYNDLKITRSGGVIPYVLECKHDLLMEWNNVHPKVKIPEVCPVCGEPLVRDGALLKCVNEKCPAIVEGKVIYWCSKDCMDIKGIGDAMVHDLIEKKVIKRAIDLYSMVETNSVEEVAFWLGEGYGERSVQKMFDAIEKSRKEKKLENIIASLGILGVGKVMGRVLANKFRSINALRNAELNDLIDIDGVGEVVAKNIYDYFRSEEGLVTVDGLLLLGGFNLESEVADNKPQNLRLNGLSLVFTGKSSRFSGDAVEEFLESNGAKCGHSVSKKTDYLIVGEKAGASKVNKAVELGVKVLTEDEFFTKFEL